MSLFEVFLTGVGLSMDAFAVSVGKGLSMKKIDKKALFFIALFFGGFQALMPFLGWLLGSRFAAYITKVDHWIAFVLLSFIGGKMIADAYKESCEETEDATDENAVVVSLGELLLLAIATSIDAFAVGITFSFLSVPIGSSVTIIGLTTFVLSAIGVLIGHRFGTKYKYRAAYAGGAILIILGVRILLSHLLGAA